MVHKQKMTNRAEGYNEDSSSVMLNAVACVSDEINAEDWRFLELDYIEYIYVHRTYEKIELVVYYERYDHNCPIAYRIQMEDGEDSLRSVDFLEEAIEAQQ
jgi:hypothetical protein